MEYSKSFSSRHRAKPFNRMAVAAGVALALGAGLAQAAPTMQARLSPDMINMRVSGGLVTVVLTASSGDLSTCSLSNLHIGTASPAYVAPSSDRKSYVLSFNKNDLASLLPGFDSAPVIVTGTLQCNGESSAMIAHATARVLKSTTVQSRVKPLLAVGGSSFKDLNGNGRLDPYEDWRLPVGQRVDDLLSRMTLAEKAGLMNITSANTANNNDFIQNRNIRFLILRENPQAGDLATRMNALQSVAEQTRLGIPLMITSNPLNTLGGGNAVFEPGGGPGQFSVWPGTLGLAATNDPQVIRDFAAISRAEWRNAGIRRMYGMQIDLVTEPRWTRNRTTFTESPQWAATIARSLVQGYQGTSVGPDSVAEVMKHFPGDGSVNKGLDPHFAEGQFSVYPTAGSLLNYQIAPFKAAVDAGVSGIMPYYCAPNNELSPAVQLPADWWFSPTQQFEQVGGAYNTALLTKLLRGQMGFQGTINSDSGILSNTAWGVPDLSLAQRWAKTVKAGINIVSDNNDPSGLIAAVNQGLLTEGELSSPVRHLLTDLFNLGLFENPYTDPVQAQAIANSAASQMVADDAHRKSLVLLRNDHQLLPIKSSINLYVEVMASGAAAATQTAGVKALLASDPTIHVVDSPAQANAALLWLYPTATELADKSAVTIELSSITGVDPDRVRAIEAAVPTILAINFANPWVIDPVESGAAAVVGTFDVKAQALIDLIHGRFTPSGKLPFSIPKNEAAVEAQAPDVPGYLENFDYVYRNGANDRYVFGFGKTAF